MKNKLSRIGYQPEDKRWRARVSYEVDDGELRQETFDVFEIGELERLIEEGPTFCAIRSFNIEYLGPKEAIKESMEN